jgi:hypothetical protein
MRRRSVLNSLNSLEYLELRLCQTSLAVAAIVSVVSAPLVNGDEDPLPNPEPPPPPEPGPDPPITYPGLPSSGPPGPG